MPTFKEFRDPKNYSGQILDKKEGQIEIVNHYRYYDGLAKNANGLIPILSYPYAKLSCRGARFPFTASIDDGHLYCTTRDFFSDSLKWAVGEHKTHCVLIKNFVEFCELVTKSFDELRFVGVRDCDYSGRFMEESNPDSTSITNYVLTYREGEVPFRKPTEYGTQREVRAVWLRHEKPEHMAALNKNIPEVANLCIPIDFSRLRLEELLPPNFSNVGLGGRFITTSGSHPEHRFQHPKELCSPVIFRKRNETEKWQIGFLYSGESNVFIGGYVRGGITGVTWLNIGPIFCSVFVNDVIRIEFFHSD